MAIALTVAITVHEFSHGYIAHRLGDDTARRAGRLSFNPLAHLDPLGTIMLFVVGFGWGKPVPVNAYYLKYGPRTGMALVGLAGPASNLAFAALLGGLISVIPPFAAELPVYIVLYNIVLAVFNLIPLPPLDGSNILRGILPYNLAVSYSRLERFGPAILIIIILIDNITRAGILWRVLRYPINFLLNLFVGQSFL
ncbi:MAG: site-2 protease family protein [Chloroflexi bacterium]|nr:site-2 protease family protein [Chloroflexota bacterium]